MQQRADYATDTINNKLYFLNYCSFYCYCENMKEMRNEKKLVFIAVNAQVITVKRYVEMNI